MEITTNGYPIQFIQTKPVRDETAHCRTYVFKFFSPVTKLHYIALAEEHLYDFFALKFYSKKDRKSDFKFFKIINRGDVANIIVSAAKVIPEILKIRNNASFGFVGARSVDLESNRVEKIRNNQRFKIYSYHIPQLIGTKTFEHITYNEASAYLLLNRKVKKREKRIRQLSEMLTTTYPDLHNVL